MPPSRILIVDDEPLQRWAMREQLTGWGYATEDAASGAAALDAYRERCPDLVLLDLRLGAESGLDVLQQIRAFDPHAAVMMITAHGDLDDAVAAFRGGLVDFFRKPVDFDALRMAIRYRLETQRLQALRDRDRDAERVEHSIIARSPALLASLRVLDKVAASNATTVLLQGESGVGKDLFARELHRRSGRRDGAFICVNCAAIPDELLESELFGHERGAFTDARALKRGVFELAEGGTLYLDEIGDLKLHLQAKLLRVIEELTFRRVGGTQDLRVDTRVVAASNRDLEASVRAGTFRADLYYRLGVIQIALPALRTRREDVAPLLEQFATTLGKRLRGRPCTVTAEAMQAALRYPWPGNVRELRNAIERAVILEDADEITARYLPGSAPLSLASPAEHPFTLPPEGVSLDRVEESLVRQAHQLAGGNQTRAARLLDISRDALRYKLKKYGIAVDAEP